MGTDYSPKIQQLHMCVCCCYFFPFTYLENIFLIPITFKLPVYNILKQMPSNKATLLLLFF